MHVIKIRKLIYNLLNYYELKEIKYDKNLPYYFLYKSTLFQSEFECLSSENRIGIYTKLNDKRAIICLNLLKMLYDRKYDFIVNVYIYIINNNIIDENIKLKEILDDTKLWAQMLSVYYNNNEININKYIEIPKPLKNFKAKVKQTFYNIKDINLHFF